MNGNRKSCTGQKVGLSVVSHLLIHEDWGPHKRQRSFSTNWGPEETVSDGSQRLSFRINSFLNSVLESPPQYYSLSRTFQVKRIVGLYPLRPHMVQAVSTEVEKEDTSPELSNVSQ